MQLVENWKSILSGSWSIWMIACALISMAALFLSLMTPDLMGVSPMVFAIASALFQTLAIPARILLQSGLTDALARFRRDTSGAVRKSTAGLLVASGVALSSTVAFVGDWEGLRTEAYRDIIGVWTVCFGETKGVQPGDSYTVDECNAMLARELIAYEAELDKCLAAPVPVPQGMKIALISWTYNVGAGAACSSTLVRKANVGDLLGACHELPRWNRAGGRVIQGLTNRRMSERALCLAALDAAA